MFINNIYKNKKNHNVKQIIIPYILFIYLMIMNINEIENLKTRES